MMEKPQEPMKVIHGKELTPGSSIEFRIDAMVSNDSLGIGIEEDPYNKRGQDVYSRKNAIKITLFTKKLEVTGRVKPYQGSAYNMNLNDVNVGDTIGVRLTPQIQGRTSLVFLWNGISHGIAIRNLPSDVCYHPILYQENSSPFGMSEGTKGVEPKYKVGSNLASVMDAQHTPFTVIRTVPIKSCKISFLCDGKVMHIPYEKCIQILNGNDAYEGIVQYPHPTKKYDAPRKQVGEHAKVVSMQTVGWVYTVRFGDRWGMVGHFNEDQIAEIIWRGHEEASNPSSASSIAPVIKTNKLHAKARKEVKSVFSEKVYEKVVQAKNLPQTLGEMRYLPEYLKDRGWSEGLAYLHQFCVMRYSQCRQGAKKAETLRNKILNRIRSREIKCEHWTKEKNSQIVGSYLYAFRMYQHLVESLDLRKIPDSDLYVENGLFLNSTDILWSIHRDLVLNKTLQDRLTIITRNGEVHPLEKSQKENFRDLIMSRGSKVGLIDDNAVLGIGDVGGTDVRAALIYAKIMGRILFGQDVHQVASLDCITMRSGICPVTVINPEKIPKGPWEKLVIMAIVPGDSPDFPSTSLGQSHPACAKHVVAIYVDKVSQTCRMVESGNSFFDHLHPRCIVSPHGIREKANLTTEPVINEPGIPYFSTQYKPKTNDRTKLPQQNDEEEIMRPDPEAARMLRLKYSRKRKRSNILSSSVNPCGNSLQGIQSTDPIGPANFEHLNPIGDRRYGDMYCSVRTTFEPYLFGSKDIVGSFEKHVKISSGAKEATDACFYRLEDGVLRFNNCEHFSFEYCHGEDKYALHQCVLHALWRLKMWTEGMEPPEVLGENARKQLTYHVKQMLGRHLWNDADVSEDGSYVLESSPFFNPCVVSPITDE